MSAQIDRAAFAAYDCYTKAVTYDLLRGTQQPDPRLHPNFARLHVQAMKVALALATKLKEYPRFAYDLSLRLHVAGKFYSAEMLLRETAEKSEPLLRLRARNALLMGDEPAALEQAYRALQLADPGGDIKKWYSELILEVEARRRRRKEQGP